MSLDEEIQATQETISFLEKQMKDPAVYVIWKRRKSLVLKELKIELHDLEKKKLQEEPI